IKRLVNSSNVPVNAIKLASTHWKISARPGVRYLAFTPSATLKNNPSRAIAYVGRAPLNTDEFIDPSAEITIAIVIQAAAPRPATCSTTSEAMCGETATAENGSTFRHAALNKK